jgi:hypothetical protein
VALAGVLLTAGAVLATLTLSTRLQLMRGSLQKRAWLPHDRRQQPTVNSSFISSACPGGGPGRNAHLLEGRWVPVELPLEI